MLKIVLTIVVLLVAASIIGLICIYGGYYNVSAMSTHNALTLWVLDETMENSVEHNADDITVPDNLNDSAVIAMGFDHYDEMCVDCHGAPGRSREEFAEGLYPKAPSLVKHAKDWTPAQLFWIIKNGIKMTGMPAFASTHTDEQIWAITAFLQKLPDLGEQGYLKMLKSHQESSESDEEDED